MQEIELSKSLHERVFEKIRDSIGDLMSDEDLKILVDAATQKAFFEEKTTGDAWNKTTIEAPLVVEIRKLLEPRVREEIKIWLHNNPEIVDAAISNALAKGMTGLVEQYFMQMIRMEMGQFQNQLQNALRGNG